MPDINLPNLLRQHAGGQKSIRVEGATIGDVLDALQAEFPGMSGQLVTADGQLHKFVNVYLNDDDVRYMQKLDTKVQDDDTVSILPAVAGGAA
ncbi:MAG: ubiquitin-like small modifier protein 1 [Acidimicrobiales bacterium]